MTLSWAYDIASNYIPMVSIVYKHTQYFPESFDSMQSGNMMRKPNDMPNVTK